jgi:2,5-furandicarboxylate decarboxylase 1
MAYFRQESDGPGGHGRYDPCAVFERQGAIQMPMEASGIRDTALSGSRQSMRAFLTALEQAGELWRVTQAVDLEFELAACLCETDSGPALHFSEVASRGTHHTLPVCGNLLNSMSRFALGLGTSVRDLQSRLVEAIEAPKPHNLVASAPCHTHTVLSPSLLDELPIPHFFEKEERGYITAGVIIAKDRQHGQTNLSIARLMPLGGNRAFVGIAPNHHLARLARAAHARGEKLDIAVCIGNHPAVLIASCLYLGYGEDELPIAGALLGEPLDVVKCKQSDLLVPAHCEVVVEGTLDAGEPYMEGAVSEFHGMYETYGAGIVATFGSLSRRSDAIFQVILPGYHPEHCLLGGVAIAAGLLRQVRQAVPCVREVAVGLGGAGRLHAVVALNEPRAGEARKAMFAVWASVNLIKQVTVVDGDINPWNATAVEWACATRVKPDRDFVIVPDVRADRSEPLEHDGTITKLGIDATRRSGDRADWDPAAPPEAAMAAAQRILSSHLRR